MTIFLPGKRLAFGTETVFEKMPRDRVRAVKSVAGESGTSVEVELGCDCRVSTTFVGGNFLALDVADRAEGPPAVTAAESAPLTGPAPAHGPQPEDPVARTARETSAVASAEQILIRADRARGEPGANPAVARHRSRGIGAG